MPKFSTLSNKAKSLVLWSIISAAFIGPGTVTTAAKSGTNYGTSLIWALVFSIFATIVLQEAAARTTLASGKSLGEIIRRQYHKWGGKISILLFAGIFIGCSAYEAGNILGSVSGFLLLNSGSKILFILLIGLIAGIVLWIGSLKWISRILGIIVAAMGIGFIYSAVFTTLEISDLLTGALIPSIPSGSELLIIGLIGTTIVPYNLFMASGIGTSQSVSEMRFGLILAILIGGIISISILITGLNISGEFGFEKLADSLEENLGSAGRILFAVGLGVAGLSSAITAPLASAITGQTLFGSAQWSPTGWKFRMTWISVLVIGLTFGIMNIKPIPVIILAQAINGLLLPLITIFLFFAINDHKYIIAQYRNHLISNLFMILIVGITIFLGSYQMTKVFTSLTSLVIPFKIAMILCSAIAVIISSLVVLKKLKTWEKKSSNQSD